MQIVIDIPKHIYEHIKEVYEHSHTVEATYSYIYNGTSLPAHHGRLIDADALIDSLGISDRDIYCKAVIEEDAPTIIEADKAESEEV